MNKLWMTMAGSTPAIALLVQALLVLRRQIPLHDVLRVIHLYKNIR